MILSKYLNSRELLNESKSRHIGGFTLIELLVVISIIGVLTTLVMANLNSARSRARDAQRKSDIRNITTALRLYFNDNSKYPTLAQFPGWGTAWNGSGSTVYMNKVPNDPLYDPNNPSPTYTYEPSLLLDSFTLTACLENPSDKQGIDSVATYGCDVPGKMFQIKP